MYFETSLRTYKPCCPQELMFCTCANDFYVIREAVRKSVIMRPYDMPHNLDGSSKKTEARFFRDNHCPVSSEDLWTDTVASTWLKTRTSIVCPQIVYGDIQRL